MIESYFHLKEFKVELINTHYCIFCTRIENKMVKVSVVTAADGIETSHVPNYVCIDCINRINESLNNKK